MYHECYVVRYRTWHRLYFCVQCQTCNPAPSNRLQIRQSGTRAPKTFELVIDSSKNRHPTPHPLGIVGVGFHIPKIAMSPMLIYLSECLLTIHDTSLEQEGVYRKKRAPLEIPPILLEDMGGRVEAIDNNSICANENEHKPPIGGPISSQVLL